MKKKEKKKKTYFVPVILVHSDFSCTIIGNNSYIQKK